MERESGQSILVGVHGSAASLAALHWAAREAVLRDGCLHVVQVWEDESRRVAPYARTRPQPGRESLAAARARLEDAALADLGRPPAVLVTTEVAEGLPARLLIDRAARASLLVLGSAASAQGTLGPVARTCLQHAPCPVVVVSALSAGIPVPA